MPETNGPARQLGRLIFRRGGNPGWGVFSLLGGTFFAGFMTWGAVALHDPSNYVMLPLTLAIGIGLMWLGVRLIRYRAAVHEQGIVVFNGFVERTMRFDQARTFSFRHRAGAAQHSIDLGLIPFEGRSLTVEVAPRWGIGSDKAMESVRAALTPRFADKMERDLRRQGSVEWVALSSSTTAPPTIVVSLTPEGYLIRSRKGDLRFLYSQIELRVGGGILHMKERSSGKNVCSFLCGTPNYYPGLAVVQKLAGPTLAPPPIHPR
jgi:hypothetical protein